MGDTILITTTADEVVSIVTAGPQGPSGSEAATLTTTGDLLYRAALANDRLGIGSEGQVLKVASGLPAWGDESGAVTSVNGATGAVTLNAADVGAAPATGISPSAITGTAVVDSDARLTDNRSPLAHKNSHSVGQADFLAPSDIGAQSLFETTTYNITSTGSFTLTAARAQIAIIVNYAGAATVTLPTSGNVSGDVAVVRANPSIGTLTVAGSAQGSETIPTTGSKRYVFDGSAWQLDPVYTHTHNASDIASGTLSHAQGGLEANVSSYNGLLKIASGSTSAVTVTAAGEALLDDADASAQRTTLGLGNSATLNTGTTAGTVAEGNHTHADLHTRSHAITSTSDHTAGNHKVFYSDGTGSIVELALGNSGEVLTSNGATSAPSFAADPVELVIACSDESTDLTTGTAKVTFRAPYAFALTAVRASVNTAPVGSTIIVDINNGANSALSTKLSIDASEKTSTTAATAAVIDTTYDDFSDDSEITIDIDQIGSTTAGKGLKVTLIGTRA